LAGTTVKDNGNVVNKAFQQSLAIHGYNISFEEVNKYMGKSKPMAISGILLDVGNVADGYVVNKVHNTFLQLMIEYYENNAEEIDGVSEVFSILKKRGIKIAVNTGFSSQISDAILAKVGWIEKELVSVAVSSDHVIVGRPAPFMIEKIADALNIDNIHICKIGDTPVDLLEGQNAKCGMVVGVYEGAFTKEELKKYYHTHLIPNINYLPAIV
jgi:phosphonatase-like hydrolase